LGELNEHFKSKFSNLSYDYSDLKIENDNFISKSKNKVTFDNYSNNNNINQNDVPKKSDFDYLKEFLAAQMKNHIIHLINVDEKKNDNWQEDFNNLSLYDQESLLNKRNQEVFADRLSKNKSSNGNGDYRNKDNHLPSAHNNSIAIIEGSAIKLTESLSLCQKIILIAGFCASELPQKFDSKIMKSVKKTGIKKRVKTFSSNFY